MLHVRREAVAHGSTVIGGNTAGVITPGEANLGIMPDIAFAPGRVGTVSRSGSITYYVADTLSRSGYGETTCVGLGGDPVLGSTFDEILWKFEEDKKTKAVVMCGEIGGVYEERATGVISKMKWGMPGRLSRARWEPPKKSWTFWPRPGRTRAVLLWISLKP